MPAPDQPATPRPRDESLHLWNEVIRARTELAVQRRLPLGSAASNARADLLDALEAYAVSLTDHGRPIPYALRDELRLQRRTR